MASAKDQDRLADEVLCGGRLIAKQVAPYFRSYLHRVNTRPVPGIGTIRMTARGIMEYDPAVIAGWKPKEMAGAFIHEVLHLWLKHHTRVHGRDPQEFNCAADRAINPMVTDMGLELPFGGGLRPADIGMKDGLAADDYYREPKGNGKGGSGQQNGGKVPSSGHAPGVGSGHCGGCAGNPGEGEAEDDDPDGLSDAQGERLARQTAEEVRAHAKQAGKVPAGIARMAEAVLEPPRIPWQKELGHVVRMATQWRPGAVQYRYDGPSRRQAGLGYGDGKPVLPRLRQPIPRVAVVMDTSGSMGGREVKDAMVEMRGILKSVGADVTFCVCDAEVHGLGQVKTIEAALTMLKGGGGTDFCPAFEALSAQKVQPDVVCFFTDGFGSAPDVPPAHYRVLWVLVGQHTRTPAPWGRVLRVPFDSK